MIKEHMQKQAAYNETLSKLQMMSNPAANSEHIYMIQQLTVENGELKDKIQYLEGKIKQLINEKIQDKLKDKQEQV
jgi:predicted nuclease with TOPRIM domain